MEFNSIKKGDHIVYSTNGVCLVDEITQMTFPGSGEQKTYLLLRPLKDAASVIYIPHDNQVLLGRLRPLLSSKQASELLNTDHCAADWIDDRKQRALAFRNLLLESDPATLLPLIKCICRKRDELITQNKKLSNADRELLSAALDAVCNEFAFTLGHSRETVEESIKISLGIAL